MISSLSDSKHEYRREIDGLRAIAVISVIINHINKMLMPNGYLGVDIFYVISGFVITLSLISRQHSSFGSYVFEFYTRRAKRLAPGLFLCITLTSILVLLFFSPEDPLSIVSLHTGITSLFGLSNFYLLKQSTDYFGSSAVLNPFTHTWSLGVEEQFYCLFPFLLWFSGLLQKRKRGIRNFFLILNITAITSIFIYYWLDKINPIMAFYLMPTRVWELSIGAIVCLLLIKFQGILNNYVHFFKYITLVALALLVAVLLLPRQSSQQITTFVIVILTGIVILGIRPSFLAYKLLTIKPFVVLGILSYSLYLWHWPILTVSRLTIGVNLLTIPFQLAVIFSLSFLSYTFVENPLRHSEWTILRVGSVRLRELKHTIGFAFIFAVMILFIVSPLHKRGYFYTGGKGAPLVKKGVKTLRDNQAYKNYSWSAENCVLLSNDDVGKVIQWKNCTFGKFQSASRHFLVIGNSFSVAEMEMYKILPAEKRGSVTITSSWGASPVPGLEVGGSWDKANNYYWDSVVPRLVEQLQAGDVILMISCGDDFIPKKESERSRKRIKDLQAKLKVFCQKMSQRGIFVIYQTGIPFMREANCSPDAAMPQWWNIVNEPSCTYYTREDSLERRRLYHESLLALQDKCKNFAVLDLFDMFCPDNLCKFYNSEGIYLYRDEWSHPSVEAGILAQSLLLETVDKLIKEQPGQ